MAESERIGKGVTNFPTGGKNVKQSEWLNKERPYQDCRNGPTSRLGARPEVSSEAV